MSETTSTSPDPNTVPGPTTDAGGAAEPVPGEVLTRTLGALYRELLEGMPPGEPTWITSGGTEGGLYGSIDDLTAQQASRDLEGTTLAAQVEHVRWALQLVNDYFDGVAPTADWSASWLVSEVDDAAWERLRRDMRRTGDRLLSNLANRQRWNEGMNMQGAFASYGHTAYHVGAVRQIRKRLLEDRD